MTDNLTIQFEKEPNGIARLDVCRSIGSKGTYTRKSHKGKEAEYLYERLLGIQDLK